GVCPACGRNASYLLLPPGRSKTPGETAFYKQMYSHADRMLSQADTWVVLGYSVPDYDEDVVAMMMRALAASRSSHRINVVAPDAKDIAGRLSNRIAHEVVPHNETFSQMV